MKTDKHFVLDLLAAPDTRFVIPAYQRPYSWKRRQCNELWLDLQRAAKADRSHFAGTLLYAREADDAQGARQLAVIDGQQRLTTITLLLVALTRHLKERDIALADLDAAALGAHYLRMGAQADAPGKLVLSRNDRDTLFAVVHDAKPPEAASENILQNLAFFQERMDEDGFDAERLWRGVKRLFVIDAQVDGTDNAQLIFESLNSKGMPLTTADLVRNYLLLAESHDEQARLYDEYWSPIEGMFRPDPGSLRLDNAIQGWLSVRFRKVRARGAGEVYGVFKQYVEDEFDGTTEGLLRELRNFCLVWAENYRYHAVKKYKSAFSWATNGAPTLVSDRPVKKSVDEAYAEKVREDLGSVDASL
ncbi:hypothetical protein C1878_02965 [Gordonibacter sp. 28C]|uniref:DUF262 domain-containing protein n=1 Tax=Gordonibacter sp. 28C TaxID=2078569 RepID=UPI000DF7C4B1|nr:DUF262 domain-containing protein [Gordonibacter sp. 28C]RDB63775.1 hypothetical protein C1878_02965 [Gordonibacter sp. 28C]